MQKRMFLFVAILTVYCLGPGTALLAAETGPPAAGMPAMGREMMPCGAAGQGQAGMMPCGTMGQEMKPGGMMGQGQRGMMPCGMMPCGTMGQGMNPCGMMGQGMNPCGMMGQGMRPCGMMGQGMKPCGMMGQGMMGGSMSPMMGKGMMPRHARGCYSMAERMMMDLLDLPQVQKLLELSDDQVDRLKAAHRPLQKEAVRNMAAMRLAEIDLADLLSADKVDMAQAEAKLKEAEAIRTSLRLGHVKSAEEVKKVLTKEQMEKFEGLCESCCAAPSQGTAGGSMMPEPQPMK